MHTIDTDIPSSLYTRRVILAAVTRSRRNTGRGLRGAPSYSTIR